MRLKPINKKAEGLLESETLRVVLAVICILLLVGLAYKLYNLFLKKSDVEQAKETLEQLVSKMNGLEEGGKDEFLIISPQGWVLMSDKEQVCICSFVDESASFFRYENRENAFQKCITNGFCSNIKNNIGQFDSCGWGAFSNCLDFKTLPLKIYMDKNQGVVSLKTKVEAVVGSMLDNILNYKKDENSKTIRELILELIEIKKRIADAGFFETMFGSGPVDESIKKQEEISASFEGYLNNLDTKKEFNCERDKLSWKMIMYKLNDKGETEGKWMSVGEKYLSGYPKEISKNQIDINGYRMMLSLNCITG